MQVMTSSAHRRSWWPYLLLAAFLFTQFINTRQEAVGPGGSGIQFAASGLTVSAVTSNSAMDRAGLRVGDIVESVGGSSLRGMSDWFVSRAQFRLNEPTAIHVRRGESLVALSFRIEGSNWHQWTPATFAFQATRWLLLAVAVALVILRPRQASATLTAVILSAMAVAEGNPSAGWLTAVRALPAPAALTVALATATWLLVPAIWPALSSELARQSRPKWSRVLSAAHLAAFAPLVALSATSMVFPSAAFSRSLPFTDFAPVRAVQSLFSVTPQIFINLGPWYSATSEAVLLSLWAGSTVALMLTGTWSVIRSVRSFHSPLQVLAIGVASAWLIGLHNVVVRNWSSLFGSSAPAALSTWDFVAEAASLCVVVLSVLRAVLAQPRRA